MKILELFAGTCSVGNAFKEHGHEVYTVDWDRNFKGITAYADVGKLTAEQVVQICGGGTPDIIWASPDCTTYSVSAISKHRIKKGNTLEPITSYAMRCDQTNKHLIELIKEVNPKYFFIENPRGRLKKNGLHATGSQGIQSHIVSTAKSE